MKSTLLQFNIGLNFYTKMNVTLAVDLVQLQLKVGV